MAIPRPQIQPKKTPAVEEDEITALARARLAKAAPPAAPAQNSTNVPLGQAVADVARNTPSRLGEISPKPTTPRGTVPNRAAPPDEMDALSRDRLDREAERKAAADELARGKANALQAADARAGLGGFGLSGGTAALQGDIGRTQDRSATLAMAEFDRRQRDDDFTSVQRQAALDDLESASDTDYDGDGMIGGRKVGADGVGDGIPDNDETDESEFQSKDQKKAKLAELNAKLDSFDHSIGDKDTTPGTIEEPFVFDGSYASLTKYVNDNGAGPLKRVTIGAGGVPGAFGQTTDAYEDAFGNVYFIPGNRQ